MANFVTDPHFQFFYQQIAEHKKIKYASLSSEDRLEQQYRQLKTLIDLEQEFVACLNETRYAPTVYQSFINFICNQKQNISAARPYFRESKFVFAKKISPIFKTRDAAALHSSNFKFNCKFITFVMNHRTWGKNSPLSKKYNDIKKIRNEIVELNLPLAVSQAKIFWKSTPESHLSYMDVIQLQVQGLLSGVDKFLPQDRKSLSHEKRLAAYRKFRPTVIGFMTRDRMVAYSQNILHFYTKDRKILYRANKLLREFQSDEDVSRLTDMINLYLGDSEKTSESEVKELVAANCMMSVSATVKISGREVDTEDFSMIEDDPESRPDCMFEKTDAMNALQKAINGLPPLEYKFLKMKGIKL